ncbi:MAG: MarR family transcriptional regulator [bacterium]|nr:MarR family transcriptional regulator [bacterium]
MKAEECIFYQITKTSQYARKVLNEKMKETSLTVGQTLVLNFLSEEDGITINDLGAKSGIDNATMTGLIDRLEKAGYIERKKDAVDRRVYLIYLTQDGKKEGKRIKKDMVNENREFLSVLTKSEEAQFRLMLKKIRRQTV